MTIAELHGKLSSSGSNADDRLEDLLTSDVFGAFTYPLPRWGRIPFINRVLEENDSSVRVPCPESKIEEPTVAYYFWPKGKYLGREPDVLVLIGVGEDQFAFVFEAKCLSGPSDIRSEEETDEDESSAPRYGLQLADQYEDLMHDPPFHEPVHVSAPRSRRFLIYITSHATMPTEVIEKSLTQLADRSRVEGVSDEIGPTRHLLWTNWHGAWHALDEIPRLGFPFDLIAEDARRLLARKGFRAFAGFGDLHLDELGSSEFWQERWFALAESCMFYSDGTFCRGGDSL